MDKVFFGVVSFRDLIIGRRRFLFGGRIVVERVEVIEGSVQESLDFVIIIYMLVGIFRGFEGFVRFVFRRFGSFQKGQVESKVKSVIFKFLRRVLSRNKGSLGSVFSFVNQSFGLVLKEEFKGILEFVGVGLEEVGRDLGVGIKNLGRVQELGFEGGFLEQDFQKLVEGEGQEEFQYENVVIIFGLLEF